MSHRGSQRQAWPCGAGAPHLPPSAHWPRRGNPKRRGDKGRSRISSLSLPLSYGKVVGGGGCSSSREDDWINRFYEENRSWQGVPFRNSGRARAAPADPSSTPTLPRPPRSAATTGDPRSPRGALSLGRPAYRASRGQRRQAIARRQPPFQRGSVPRISRGGTSGPTALTFRDSRPKMLRR